ncbi:MAG: BadF/BadG/BcrA/BcrD ATPase family protein [Paracoccus sp. (in: a-proteobacteria)]|nr:BadF/BadG/BcrA/BcrD ATPase family protein [Paracoccus sp. (in: a-proteobacteria)]
MAHYLGIDGGGSGCRAVVADASGALLGTGSGGPANILTDPEGARASIIAAATEAMRATGLSRVDAAGLGLAGANAAGAVAALDLDLALPAGAMRIETDAMTATLGALGPADGVVAAIGTGSVFGLREGAGFRQIGGRGLVLGDEGSGAWMGRLALARALRAEDGHGAMTPYLAGLIEAHGGGVGVIAFARRATPADFAALMPGLLAAADDPAAASILADAEAEILAAIEILRGGRDLPVVFLGGLGGVMAARLAGRVPIRAPVGTALDGALMLARGL